MGKLATFLSLSLGFALGHYLFDTSLTLMLGQVTGAGGALFIYALVGGQSE